MKIPTLLAIAAVTTLTVVACDKKETLKSKNQIHTENYSYQFQSNGCDTKKHEFASMNELCAAIQDEDLNSGCAQNLRANYFKDHCPGTFIPYAKSSPSEGDPSTEEIPEGMEVIKMAPDELKSIQFLNPFGEQAKTTVYCLSESEAAANFLEQDGVGGVILAAGGSIVLKKIPQSSTTQEESIRTLTMISCEYMNKE